MADDRTLGEPGRQELQRRRRTQLFLIEFEPEFQFQFGFAQFQRWQQFSSQQHPQFQWRQQEFHLGPWLELQCGEQRRA